MRSHYHILCIILAFIGIAGCSASRPQPETTEQRLSLTPAVATQFTAEAEWWRSYGDEQLNTLVAKAINRNLDLAKAAITVNRALYTARRIGADQLPAFSGTGSGSAKRDDISTGGNSSRTVGTELSVSYELDLWRKLADAASAKEWEYHATVEDKEAAWHTVVTSTADFYFELYYLHDAIAATQQSIENYKQIKRVTDLRHKHGKISALEAEQAAQVLLSEEKRLADFTIRQQEIEKGLRELLVYEPTTPLNLTFTQPPAYKNTAINLNVPTAVLARRPDLKAAEYRLQGAFKDVRAAQKSWLPNITLSSAIGTSADSVGTLFDVPFSSGAIRLNLPFLQWNTVKWNVKISEADYDLLKVDFEKKLNVALNEVTLALAYHNNAEVKRRNAEERYAHARKISDIQKLQYEHGKREFSDWLESLNTTHTVWLEVLENRYQTFRRTNGVYKSMAGKY